MKNRLTHTQKEGTEVSVWKFSFFSPKKKGLKITLLLFPRAVTPSHVSDGEYTQDGVLSCDMIISLGSETTSGVCPTLMPQFGKHDLIYLNSKRQYIHRLRGLAAVPKPSSSPSGRPPLRDVSRICVTLLVWKI